MDTISIIKILYITGIIVWCLPPIRQFRGRFFYFFLILAIIDPLHILYGLTTKTNLPGWVSIVFVYLCIISVLSGETIKKYRYVIIVIPILFAFLIPFQNNRSSNIVLLLGLVFILLVLLKNLIMIYVNQKKIKFFYIMLVFYITTNILKYFNLIIGFAEAYAFYIITTITQIAFGLYFSIGRED